MKKCIVKDCTNTDGPETGGEFIGDLCSPCHEYITTGKGVYSQAYRNAHTKVPVKLQYYKPNGKYYTTGEYESSRTMLYDIVREVREMRDAGKLPGLVAGAVEFIIYIEGNEPFGVPHIVPMKVPSDA